MQWYIEGGGNYVIKGEKIWGRNIMVSSDEEDLIRERFKNQDVFATVYKYSTQDQKTADIIAPFYIDLDMNIKNEADYRIIKKDLLHIITAMSTTYQIPEEHIRVYFSGHKGFHVLVSPEVIGMKACKNLNDKYKVIARDMKAVTLFKTVDTGIYDRVRLFRLVNSMNSKTGLYKVPVSIDFVRQSSFEDMVDYASMPREENWPQPKLDHDAARKFKEKINELTQLQEERTARSNSPFTGKGTMLPCMKEMLKTPGIAGVNRNKMAVTIASSLCQSGFDAAKAEELITEWNDNHNIPKLPLYEIRKTIESAYSGAQNGKGYGCRAIQELGMCVTGPCRVRDNKGKPKQDTINGISKKARY